jgi:threonine dehydrogenase-like Zn-dependent dehydrogenase
MRRVRVLPQRHVLPLHDRRLDSRQPKSSVGIVGAGSIGPTALLAAQSYIPAEIMMIDLDDNRL